MPSPDERVRSKLGCRFQFEAQRDPPGV
jgi:hypothetical protein